MQRKWLFGLPFISDQDYTAITECILHYKKHSASSVPLVITPNVHNTLALLRLPKLLPFFQKSLLVLPDGQPIITASRALKKPLEKRLTGSDLFPLVWKRMMAQQKRIFLIASSNSILESLQQEYPSTRGYIPPFFEDNKEEDLKKIARQIFEGIQTEMIEYIFLGIGCPKQELLSYHLYHLYLEAKTESPLFINVGAALEYYTGLKKRAPLWMQKAGIEWIFRLCQEPFRLFPRYFWDSGHFFLLFCKTLLKKDIGR